MYLFNAILIHVQRNFMLRPVVRNQGRIARPPAQRRYLYAQNKIPIFIIQSKRINTCVLSVRHKKGGSLMTRLFINGLIIS
jgi:hypothetical protein